MKKKSGLFCKQMRRLCDKDMAKRARVKDMLSGTAVEIRYSCIQERPALVDKHLPYCSMFEASSSSTYFFPI